MTGESTTGPVFLGRWSQPAALTNAGFIPPDPYPLEKILFCATCGQQFFGAHLTSGTDQPGSARTYRTACDCRPEALSANEVELRVYAETHVHAFGTDTVTGLTSVHYALLAVRVFSRVEIGPTVDDITFANRI